MNHISRNVFLVLLLLTAFGTLFANGEIPLFGADEQYFMETAREMVQFHDYLVPRLHNVYMLDVPPLHYWLTAGAFSVFGISVFAVRFPPAVMSILTVLMIYFVSTKLWSERTGFWAGMITGSTMLFFYTGKASVTDATCLFFVTGALLCFMHEMYWLQYIFGGLSVLALGPPGLLFPVGIILCYLLLTGQMRRLRKMHVLPGFALSFAICLPWYFLMYETYGMDFLKTVFRYENFIYIGLTGKGTQNINIWWYYIPILFAGIFPWTGLLLKSIKDGICESRTVDLRRNIFLQIWWFLLFIYISLCPIRRPGTLSIVFPALAMLIGWNMERMIREDRTHFKSWALGSLVSYILAAAAWIIGGRQLPELTFGTMVLGVITLLLGVAVVVSLLVYKDGMLAAWLHVATSLLTVIIVCFFLLPVVADRFGARGIATNPIKGNDGFSVKCSTMTKQMVENS